MATESTPGLDPELLERQRLALEQLLLELSQQVDRLIEDRGISIRATARLSGVDGKTMTTLLAARRDVRVSTIVDAVIALGGRVEIRILP